MPWSTACCRTIKSYEPHDFFSMDFHFAPPGEKVDARTLVEVRFYRSWKQTNAGRVAIFEGAYKAACGG